MRQKANDELIYIRASINGRDIYIKVPISAIMIIHDTLVDGEYKVHQATQIEWKYQIAYGNSYTVDSVEEAKEFQRNNLKFRSK